MIKIILFFIFYSFISNASVENKISCKDCNLIVISLSNLRPKNMSLYNYSRQTTPNIDQFFKNSFVFDQAIAPASLTFVDALSFFYSLNPIKHQIFNRKKMKKNYNEIAKFESITTILKKNNYKTAAFVSDEDYAFEWGMSKNFDLYFDKTKYADAGILFRPQSYNIGIKSLNEPSIAWIRKNKNSKFFMFLQSFDMHCPYGPNEKFSSLYQSKHNVSIPFETDCFMNRVPLVPIKDKNSIKYKLSSFLAFKLNNQKDYLFTEDDLKYLNSRYDAELTKTDFYLSYLFEQIKQLQLEKNTIIILMSEHGDNLGENNFYMKSNNVAEGNLHNANLNFALAIKIPNHHSHKKTHNQMIQTIDIAPSILDLLNISTAKSMQGKSFIPILNTDNEINDYNFGYSIRINIESVEDFADTFNRFEVVQNHEWKYYQAQEFSFEQKPIKKMKTYLFNLKKDPEEKFNLAQVDIAQAKKMSAILELKSKLYSFQK